MRDNPVENLLREATEVYTVITCTCCALLAAMKPHFLLLTPGIGWVAMLSLLTFGSIRAIQAYRVKRYHFRLKQMPFYGLKTREVPLSKKWLFVGKGFRWEPIHTQRLHQIRQVKNKRFTTPGNLYQKAREYVKTHPNTRLSQILNSNQRLNPFKPLPDVGGEPFLHGLGVIDKPVFIPQNVRVGHTFVLGTTRVGKTRLASILINQDIRSGESVIVVDPKGDLDLVRDMYSACLAANRLDDFKAVHLGFPEISATYNPLKNFDQITEVATRITNAIDAEGEGKRFAAFAWKYVDIVAKALAQMNRPLTYKNIAFFITRLDHLLMSYADKVMPEKDAGYTIGVANIIAEHNSKVDKNGNPYPPMERKKAVLKYIAEYIGSIIEQGAIEAFHGDLLIELFDAASLDKQYYDKITASVGPVFSEINGSNASEIFSAAKSDSDIELMDVIKNKKVLYIGLDSLTNEKVAQAVGKAFLSDLVSTAGKIYKESDANYKLNLHCDELSEIIQESFVKILNKAGGAGFQVTAYAQTIQDLEVALGSKAKAQMTEGNLNTVIMLRPKNADSARLITDILPEVDVVGHTQVSQVNDSPHGNNNEYFNTTNEDRVQMNSIPMLSACDVTQLPKGQAFVLVNGGELYKVRIPLPVNDGLAPDDIKQVMNEINHIKEQTV